VTDTRWHRAPHILWRRSLDAVLVLPPGLEEPIALGGTGPELWALLAEERSTDDIVAILAVAHGAEPAVVAVDVVPMLERLADLGAVRTITA
jgi:hypothetical protein